MARPQSIDAAAPTDGSADKVRIRFLRDHEELLGQPGAPGNPRIAAGETAERSRAGAEILIGLGVAEIAGDKAKRPARSASAKPKAGAATKPTASKASGPAASPVTAGGADVSEPDAADASADE